MAAPPPSYGDATGGYTNPPYPAQAAPPFTYPGQAQGAPAFTAPYPTEGSNIHVQGSNVNPYGGYPGGYPQQHAGAPPPMPPPPVRFTPEMAGALDDTSRSRSDSESGGIMGTEWAGDSFSDKAIRRAFIRKVYLILTAQLSLTVAFICFFMFHKPTHDWIQGDGFWFYYLSYGVFLVTYITLVCCPAVRRKWPGNFICLAIFTLAFSYMTGTITSFYDTKVVLIAAGITCLVTLSISLFAIQTKIDFTLCSGLIFALSMVVFFFGISCMIVFMVWGPNYILQCVYGAIAALLFSLFLAYDTQMLVGGRKHQLSPEEHIYGALQLYLDVVYLFLIILSFFGGKSN